jgi:hypothetical protein
MQRMTWEWLPHATQVVDLLAWHYQSHGTPIKVAHKHTTRCLYCLRHLAVLSRGTAHQGGVRQPDATMSQPLTHVTRASIWSYLLATPSAHHRRPAHASSSNAQQNWVTGTSTDSNPSSQLARKQITRHNEQHLQQFTAWTTHTYKSSRRH